MRYQPSPTTADFAKVGLYRFRRSTATLERFDGRSWVPLARLGSIGDANNALDDAVATGEQADRLRVIEGGASRATRIALVVGGVIAAAIIASFSYVMLGSKQYGVSICTYRRPAAPQRHLDRVLTSLRAHTGPNVASLTVTAEHHGKHRHVRSPGVSRV